MRRVAALLTAGSLAACGSTATTRRPMTPQGTVTVFAASSLAESFTEMGRRLHATHPGLELRFNFDASSTLAHQVADGAPADVLATADETTMQRAVDAGAVAPPAVFARNRLAVVVAEGNPAGVRSLADLARPGLVVVLCAPEVPCGRAGAQALAQAGVALTPRSLEPNVKGVVAKVVMGEADAGIVYVTDVHAAGGKAHDVPIPDRHNVVVSYPIAATTASGNRLGADTFVAFVRSAEGRSVLAAAGFDTASP